MREESYPVEGAKGGWELIASPVNGGSRGPNGGMDYFAFNDLKEKSQNSSKPAYTDPEHGEYYHSSAELPGSTDKVKKVRTLLYSDRNFRDYEMKMTGQGKVGSVVPGIKGKICDNIFTPVGRTPESAAKFRNAQIEIQRVEREFFQTNQNPTEAERLTQRTQLLEMRTAAENEYYGPDYTANRAAAAIVRAKQESANKAYRALPAYLSGEQDLSAARRAHEIARRTVESTPEIGAISTMMAEIQSEYNRSTTSGTRRRELSAEYSALQDQKSRSLQTARNSSPEVLAANQTLANAEKAWALVAASPDAMLVTQLGREAERLDVESWQYKEGKKLANPVLSKDGTHVAGLVNGKIEVFQIASDGMCTLIAKTDFRGSKVSFSYPKPGSPLQITFTAEGGAAGEFRNQAYVYDLSSNKATVISSPEDRSAAYPGFTVDGRVMYKTSSGMAIIDPLQVAKNGCTPAAPGAARSATQNGGTVQ